MPFEENLYLVNEAAEKAGTTSETLRHYDRIGLISPLRKENGYRYYTAEQTLLVSIVRKLQSIGFSLEEAKEMFALGSLEEVRAFLKAADRRCLEKLRELKETRKTIKKAIAQYTRQLSEERLIEGQEAFYEDRYILLSASLKEASLQTLYDYRSHYREELGPDFDSFSFKDRAGIYVKGSERKLFIECEKPGRPSPRVVFLPQGRYMSIPCREEDKEEAIAEIERRFEERKGRPPAAIVLLIEVTGIAKWGYLAQAKID